jgi:hypothetical protein
MTCQPRITREELLLLSKACKIYAEILDQKLQEKKELQYQIQALQLEFTLTADREVFLKLKAAKAELAKRKTVGVFGESEAAKVLSIRLGALTKNHRFHSANVTTFYLRHLKPKTP